MKATRLPSGNYRAIAYLGTDCTGKRIQKSFTAADAKHAVALASAYEDQYRLIRDNNSFDVAMDRFIKSRSGTLSPSTHRDYMSFSRCLRRSYPAFCAKNMVSINGDDIRAIIAHMQAIQPPKHRLQKQARAASPKTIKNYVGFISAVFRYTGVPMPHVELPERVVPDIYVPTDDEVKILIDAVLGTEMYIPVLLAAFAPLRRGEICALKYPRDFHENVIHVRESIADTGSGNLHRKQPKTPFSNRLIEMPGFVIDAIRQQGYVTKLTPGQITARFPHVLHKAGLPPFRFHDLRHYCVSTLHAQGVVDASIMKRGGWSTDAVLKRVYRHVLADQDAAQTKRALAHFDNIFLSARDENPCRNTK